MTREELLKAFAEMAPEDQEAVRTQLFGEGASRPKAGACVPDAMRQQMMKNVEASDDPIACCREMMGMCREKMQELEGAGSPR